MLLAAGVACAIIVANEGATRVAAAKVIGTNIIAQPVTLERIATLPANQRKAWRDYLARSAAQQARDKAAFQAEMKSAGVTTPQPAPAGRNAIDLPMNNPPEYYATADAVRIAANIVSYQLPDGGWSKNIAMTAHPRAPGDRYDTDNLNRFPDPDDFDKAADPSWHYLATLDNDATYSQIVFLARVTTALLGAHHDADAAPFRAAVERGIEYLLDSQYPNGGWPQVWPLEGGYHDAITINDDADLHAIEVLAAVGQALLPVRRSTQQESPGQAFAPVRRSAQREDPGQTFSFVRHSPQQENPGQAGVPVLPNDASDYAYVSAALRKRAAAAAERGIALLLQLQIVENGKRTAWAQQYDALTLAPTSARNYEMASISSGESVSIVEFLMQLPRPTPAEIAAVHAAAAWFTATEIFGVRWGTGDFRADRTNPDGRRLVAAPGAGPIWSRYYQIGTDTPIFGDRDKTIHDDVNEISRERRNGYSWYNSEGVAMLADYKTWTANHPLQ
jgi:hypothetical protein